MPWKSPFPRLFQVLGVKDERKGRYRRMLTMAEIDDIREAYYAKGKTISEIAREHAKDRKTVRKYILREDFNVTGLVARKKAGQHPKLEPYEATIDGWLESDRRMRRKQRHTARR
jgi:DNA-binding CsgD family transcriptional regulator